MATPSLLSPQEFAGKIRDKYPGAYDSVPDDELTQRVVRKYPQYASQVQLATTGAAQPQINMQPAPMSGFQSTIAGLTEGPSSETGSVRNPKAEIAMKGEDPSGLTGSAISAVTAAGVALPLLQPAGQWVARNPIKSMAALELAKQTPLAPYISKIPSWLPLLASEGSGLSAIARRRLGLSQAEGAAAAEAGAARGEIAPPSTDQIPNRPYQPNPRYAPSPAPAEPIPPRSGLQLSGEVAAQPAITRAEVEQQLNQSLGGTPLRRGVPLRNQPGFPGAQASAPSAAGLSEGFTSVPQSSVLRSFKYDPSTRELTSVLKSGETYVHGDIDPSAAAEFAAAPSGAAWNQLKQSGTLVGKFVSGKRVNVRPSSLRDALVRKPK